MDPFREPYIERYEYQTFGYSEIAEFRAKVDEFAAAGWRLVGFSATSDQNGWTARYFAVMERKAQ